MAAFRADKPGRTRDLDDMCDHLVDTCETENVVERLRPGADR